MKDTETVYGKNGIKRLKSLMDNTRVGMLATNLSKIPFSVCPMAIQEIDDQGDLWFLTNKQSDHFKEIEDDNRVQLVYANENNQVYLSIFGNATHIVSDSKVDALWDPRLRTWFSGKNDPNLVVLCINVVSAFYWNNKINRLISLSEEMHNENEFIGSSATSKGHINM